MINIGTKSINMSDIMVYLDKLELELVVLSADSVNKKLDSDLD